MDTLTRSEVLAFGFRIKVSGASLHLHDLLNRYIFPSFPRTHTSSGTPDVLVRIQEDSGHYHLEFNDERLSVADNPLHLIPELIQQLDDVIVPKLEHLRAVHAGAVQIGNRALLLPGYSHAGKSSMVAELLQHGAAYLSDEYALIDASGCVHAYPRPLLIRDSGPSRKAILPTEFNAATGATPVPIGWIMELEYRNGEGWNASPVPQSHGVMALLRHTPHVLGDAPDVLDKFERAARGSLSFTGRRMDASIAAGEILRLIGMN